MQTGGDTGPKALAERVIQEFKDKYPDFMRVLNRKNKIKNIRRAPQWSEATLKKKADYREANKEKLAERDRKRAPYTSSTNLSQRVGERRISTSSMDVMELVNAKESPDTRGLKFLLGKTKPKETIIGKVENREKSSKG